MYTYYANIARKLAIIAVRRNYFEICTGRVRKKCSSGMYMWKTFG